MHRQGDYSTFPLKECAMEESDSARTETARYQPKAKPTNANSNKLHKEEKQEDEIVPTSTDVLLGRGGHNNKHIGNEKLRELARRVADKYHRSTKKEKSNLSRTLIDQVRSMDPPGRFLRRHPKDNRWEDVSNDEDKCREKCAQVLRDAVAYVGLKEPSNPTSSRALGDPQQRGFASQPHGMPQMPSVNTHAFSMSAASGNALMNHHLMARGDMSPSVGRRPMVFSQFNPLSPASVTRSSLGLGSTPGAYDALALPGFSQMPPQPMSQNSSSFAASAAGTSVSQQPGRPQKRRRISNFFERYATLPGDQSNIVSGPYMASGSGSVLDRRLSLSNSQPVGHDHYQQTMLGPRVPMRRDSLYGNLSIRSDHSMAGGRDFELFPDLAADVNEAPKDESEEFASDFY